MPQKKKTRESSLPCRTLPATHELPARLEFHNRLSAAMKHQDIAARRRGHGCHLDEIPRTGREAGSAGGLDRPIHILVIQSGDIGTLLGGNLTLLAKSNAEKTKQQ